MSGRASEVSLNFPGGNRIVSSSLCRFNQIWYRFNLTVRGGNCRCNLISKMSRVSWIEPQYKTRKMLALTFVFVDVSHRIVLHGRGVYVTCLRRSQQRRLLYCEKSRKLNAITNRNLFLREYFWKKNIL